MFQVALRDGGDQIIVVEPSADFVLTQTGGDAFEVPFFQGAAVGGDAFPNFNFTLCERSALFARLYFLMVSI